MLFDVDFHVKNDDDRYSIEDDDDLSLLNVFVDERCYLLNLLHRFDELLSTMTLTKMVDLSIDHPFDWLNVKTTKIR